MASPFPNLEAALDRLPTAYPGPGGAAAVVHEGRVLEARAWGYANAEAAIPFTPRSLFRVCSITKQFTCALALTLCPDLEDLDGLLAERLPLLEERRPGARHLCHNQSGLRDYWTLAMMQGSPAEAPFGDREARVLMSSARTLQFRPGARYAYANQNFRLLSDLLEARAGGAFGDLLRKEILGPSGMEGAFLAADTSALPDGGCGYEAAAQGGHRPAVNRIFWTGDAGLAASLEDMIAWERRIDRERDDPQGLYARLCAPVAFGDGAPAAYGFGLARGQESGVAVTGHGGALRGWRSHRLHVAERRLSIVVFFNHLSDASAAALELLAAALGAPPPAPRLEAPRPDWLGTWIDPETGLAARLEEAGAGRVRLGFGHGAELLDLTADGGAGGASVRIEPDGAALRMLRPKENLATRLERPPQAAPGEPCGRWRCEELSSDIVIEDAGGTLYGGFEGPLGRGRREALVDLGGGVFLLPCWRALDHTPPGEFTLRLHAGGALLEAGCWLARGLAYRRT